MGNKPSSVVNKTENSTKVVEQISGEGGHIVNKEFVLNDSMVAAEELPLEAVDSDSDSDSNYSDSDDEDEDDEDLLERLRILEDARKLKQLAVAFLHPEAPVVPDGTAFARCYFDRASAPEQESTEDTVERSMALADAAALKRLAVDYMHPELGVVTSDPSATARCYFDRASAPEQESVEDAEERAMALAVAAALKRLAVDYMHPELGVVTSDPSATARCYFDRASAPQKLDSTSVSAHKKATTIAKMRVTKIVPTPGVKTVESAVNNSGIVKSVSAVQLYGLDEDNCDPSF